MEVCLYNLGRPTDGRYGENPNRLDITTNQVLIKPSPSNIQDLYIKSLEAIGVIKKARPSLWRTTRNHRLWCLGFELGSLARWCGNTQFLFQQCGGFPLSISVELTYGLERIAIFYNVLTTSKTFNGWKAIPTKMFICETKRASSGFFEHYNTEKLLNFCVEEEASIRQRFGDARL